MSEQTAVQQKPTYMVMAVLGRIDSQRHYQGKYYTQLTTPAPDEYSRPSQFEVRSEAPLGQIGTEWRGKLRASGFIRQRQYTDKQTGELKYVADKTVIFDLYTK